jgi:hypothetical protein
MKRMKITGLLVFLLAAWVAGAQTNNPGWPDCRNPVRVLGARGTVDLTPLFEWWTQQAAVTNDVAAVSGTNARPQASRPLSAWFRITGTKVEAVEDSWVVDAVIYSSPTKFTSARIILSDPPVLEEQRFNTLQSQLADLDRRIAEARNGYVADTNAEAQAQTMVDLNHRVWGKPAARSAALNSRIETQKRAAASTATKLLDQLRTEREQVEIQLRSIPSVNGVYQVDWFAMLLGHNRQGLLIFDLGSVSP